MYFELKYDRLGRGCHQTDRRQKGYLTPYLAEGKRLIKVGVNYDSTQRTMGDWIIKEE